MKWEQNTDGLNLFHSINDVKENRMENPYQWFCYTELNTEQNVHVTMLCSGFIIKRIKFDTLGLHKHTVNNIWKVVLSAK